MAEQSQSVLTRSLREVAERLYTHLEYVYNKHGALWPAMDRQQTKELLQQCAEELKINDE